MSIVAVDTSVLLSIFKGEQRGEAWLDRLQLEAESGSLLLSSIVLAETRSFFRTDEQCRSALRKLEIRHSPLGDEATLLAGKIFGQYRKEDGPRKTILPDFLVAAHAATQAELLATEDRGYLRRYFPAIRLLALTTPDAK